MKIPKYLAAGAALTIALAATGVSASAQTTTTTTSTTTPTTSTTTPAVPTILRPTSWSSPGHASRHPIVPKLRTPWPFTCLRPPAGVYVNGNWVPAAYLAGAASGNYIVGAPGCTNPWRPPRRCPSVPRRHS